MKLTIFLIIALVIINIFLHNEITELKQEVSNLNKKLDIRDEQILSLNKEIDDHYQFDKVIKELRRVK